MKEQWRPVVGYEGLYEVSNFGRIASLHYRHSNKRVEIRPFNQCGYLRIRLAKDGVNKKMFVHQIVASAFIDNPLGFSEIDHINGIKDDNRVENLRWCTHMVNIANPVTKNNMRHYGKDNHFYGKHHSQKTKDAIADYFGKAVLQYTTSGIFVKEWKSTMEVQRTLGIHNSQISACCLRKPHSLTAGGFVWLYKG